MYVTLNRVFFSASTIFKCTFEPGTKCVMDNTDTDDFNLTIRTVSMTGDDVYFYALYRLKVSIYLIANACVFLKRNTYFPF